MNEHGNGRRLKTVRVSNSLICGLIEAGTRHGGYMVLFGAPKGTVLVDVKYDGFNGHTDFLVMHESFPALKDGELAPFLDPVFRDAI